MNIYTPTIKDIAAEIRFFFNDPEKMISDCLNNLPTKDGIIKSIGSSFDDVVKWAKGSSMKQYKKDCKKVIVNYLKTGELKGIEELESPKKISKKDEKISMKDIKTVIKTMYKEGLTVIEPTLEDMCDLIYNKINSKIIDI